MELINSHPHASYFVTVENEEIRARILVTVSPPSNKKFTMVAHDKISGGGEVFPIRNLAQFNQTIDRYDLSDPQKDRVRTFISRWGLRP